MPEFPKYPPEFWQNFYKEPAGRLRGVARFGEPVKIHPLYKFARWSALFAGITYGIMRNKFLQKRADKFKDMRYKKKAERLIREAEEKVQKEKASILELETVTGAKLY